MRLKVISYQCKMQACAKLFALSVLCADSTCICEFVDCTSKTFLKFASVPPGGIKVRFLGIEYFISE